MESAEPDQKTTTSPPENPFDPMIPGHVVVPEAEADRAFGLLDQLHPDRTYLLDEGELAGRACGGRDLDEGEEAALAAIAERIAYFRLEDATAEGTLDTIRRLREAELDARPYFYCWPFNHWDLQPGEDRQTVGSVPTDLADLGAETGGGNTWPVYVVDSGYDPGNPWAGGALQNVSFDGPHGGDPAHGTFVTALIGAVAPGAQIRVYETDLNHQMPAPAAGQNTVSAANELAVGVQIQKAIDAHGSGNGPGVLNLSLGTYETHIQLSGTSQSLVPLTLESVLAQADDEMVIVAAGGNELPHLWKGDIAYPASASRVLGIGAGDADGGQTLRWYLWLGPGRTRVEQATKHPSLEALAPGLDLQAPDGAGYARWSGSSFAAALYSGYLAANAGSAPAESKADYPLALFS